MKLDQGWGAIHGDALCERFSTVVNDR